MSRHFFDLMLGLLRVRKDRAVAQSRRVQAELQRVEGFKNQLDGYAQEYESQWLNAAQQGESVRNLRVQMDFGVRLRDTARAQEPELMALTQQASKAKQQAMAESDRFKTFQAFRARQKQQAQLEQERKEQRELEDLLQARHKGK